MMFSMFESVLGWGYGVLALATALAAALAMADWLPSPSRSGRTVALDGLRGYLAFGVFLHHSMVWYFYLRTGDWALPPTSVYRNLGTVCVSLFFMITGFLFVGKLIEGRSKPIDWLALFTSRVLRLLPLYVVAMIVLLLMVGAFSEWHRHEPPLMLLGNAATWLSFSILGTPDVNALPATGSLIAFVTWSLAYEWMFYLSLPILAIAFRVKVPLLLSVLCAVLLFWIVEHRLVTIFQSTFVKGGIAALVARQPRIAVWLRRPEFAVLVLIVAYVAMQDTSAIPRLLPVSLALAFCSVACGNTVFGILSNKAAVTLGDISYGVYLLHGLLLSIVFILLLGPERSKSLSPDVYWCVVTGIGAVVTFASTMTYRFIELPAMMNVKRLTLWLSSRNWPPARRLPF